MRKLKKDYQRKDWRNPFFPKKSRPKKRKRIKFLVLILFDVFIAGLYFLNLAEQRKAENVIIEGNEQLASVLWVTGAEQYYLDSSGSAVRKIEESDLVVQTGEAGVEVIRPEASAGRYPVVWDQSNDSVGIGQPVIAGDQLNFIVILNDRLVQSADFDISHYNLANAKARDITLVVKEGWEAYFTFDDSAENQVELLLSVLQQKIKNRRDLEYVDLRFGEKIFWK